MKKHINLKKLKKLKVIMLVEESETLCKSYLEKSKDGLNSSKILLDNKQFSYSIVLSYFSMYNSLLALLFRCGIKSENHNASIYFLPRIFGIEDDEIKIGKKKRKSQQYYTASSASTKDAVEMIRATEKFNGEIFDFIERLNSGKINEYRMKFEELIE